MRLRFTTFFVLMLLGSSAAAAPLDLQAVNDAQWKAPSPAVEKGRIAANLIKAQVLLDRAHFSPGEIDGKTGTNFKKALAAFAASRSLNSGSELTEEAWRELASAGSDPVLTEYTISDQDVRGPFVRHIPANLEKMKDLASLGYTNAREKIAEKFHMSPHLLAALNPRKKFDKAGDKIVVASVGPGDLPEKVVRIEVDKSDQVVKVFGRDQKLLAFYPATVGSTEKPAPSGRLKVTSVSKNPTYRYNPDYAFAGVRAKKPFTIKPGPNNPVGSVWIGLSAEGYGIHGTPDPANIGKTESHGCVRLTNWDALALSSAVAKGVPVDFSGEQQATDRGTRPGSAQRHR
jgi:lipoprotein-anchoring transpeptidase ErfK/SrfK